MTVSASTSRADYTGNGTTTAFSVPFYFLENSHLKVIKTSTSGTATTLVLTTDYSVSGAGVLAGGTVTTVTAPASGEKISILRNVPIEQQTNYVPNDPFPAESHEAALDKLTMIAQQLNEVDSRSLTLSPNSTGVSTSLPTPAPAKVLGWDISGTSLQNYDTSSFLTTIGSSGFVTQTFSGTGAQTAFTLSSAPGLVANLDVFVSGVRQVPTTDYTVVATTLTFTTAPPSGTNNILCKWGATYGIGIPSDGSVTAAKLDNSFYATLAKAGANTDITSLNAPSLGSATATTQTAGDNSTKVATTAYADAAAAANVASSKIQPITASVGSNELTLTLNATKLDFRSSTLSSGTVNTRTISSPISVTVSSGSTLGTVNATAARLVVIAIDNAGTVELAVTNLSGGLNLDETTLISTTAEGGAGAADSATVIYSTTARSNVPFRVVGFIDITEATAGTWASAPTAIQGIGGQALAAMSSLGYGQTWQVVTRTLGTSYYNTTGKPIVLFGGGVSSGAGSIVITATINGFGLQFVSHTVSAGGWAASGSCIIPPNATYVLSATNVSSTSAVELR